MSVRVSTVRLGDLIFFEGGRKNFQILFWGGEKNTLLKTLVRSVGLQRFLRVYFFVDGFSFHNEDDICQCSESACLTFVSEFDF